MGLEVDNASSVQHTSGSLAQGRPLHEHVQNSQHTTSTDTSKNGKEDERSKQPRSQDQWLKVSKSFIAGGIAGSTAKTCIAPLDRAKILFQTSRNTFSIRAAFSVLANIVKEEGVRAMWRGNSATVARVYPYSGIQLMSYDQFRRIVLAFHGKESGRLRKRDKFLCGAAAGAVSVMATYPLDLMRAKLAVQRGENRYYKGMRKLFYFAL